MGLLDAIFDPSSYNGGGLLGALPSWQWKNPAEENANKDFISAIAQNPYEGVGGAGPRDPFGPVPQTTMPQPQSVFSTGAQPYGAAPFTAAPPMFAQPPAAPGAHGAAPGAAAAPAPQPPMPTPPPQSSGPINTMDVGGYKMPQFGTVADYTPQPDQTPTDVSAQSRAAPTTVPVFLQPQSSGGFGGAARGAMANMQNGPLGLLAGAIAGGMGMGQGSPQDVQRQNQKAQYEAFINAGMSPQKAMLAILNPEAGKTLIDQALSNKQKWGEIGTDAFGNKNMGWIDETNQTINGKPMGDGGDAAGGSAGTGNGGGGMLASGVKGVDSSLSGKDYLAQFSPEVQAAVDDYISGRSMPTGNPRKGFTATVKMIAQKYGRDIGVPADDTAYAERRQMRTQIAGSSNSSMGGILSNGKSAFEHLKTYSDKLADVGNVNFDVPLGGIAANVYNGVTNYGSGSAQRGKIAAATESGLKYGQESTKFYSGSGGGAEERLAALRANDANSKSGAEQAGFLQAERELMVGRLKEKEAQIRDVLGQDYIDKHPVFTPELKSTIQAIDANIAKLQSGKSAPANSSNSGAKPQTVMQNGHTYTLQADGSYK